MLKVKNRFDEIFEIEIDGWCYGISHFPGEIYRGLIHRVVKELAVTFRAAIEHHYVFNLLDVAHRLSKASKYIVHEKEIAFAILAQFPHPGDFEEEEQFIEAQIIDQVEQAYGGALARLQRRWTYQAEERKKELANPKRRATNTPPQAQSDSLAAAKAHAA